MKTLAVKIFFCTNILYCYYYYGIFFSLSRRLICLFLTISLVTDY